MTDAEVARRLREESQRTLPDYHAYLPGHWDGSGGDGLNEHFLVFDGPDGVLMAVWTQSAQPAGVRDAGGVASSRQHNHIVFASSGDEGATWTQPLAIAGPRPAAPEDLMASWGFPLVSASGRIYVIY